MIPILWNGILKIAILLFLFVGEVLNVLLFIPDRFLTGKNA
jgi:hypothetical protein